MLSNDASRLAHFPAEQLSVISETHRWAGAMIMLMAAAAGRRRYRTAGQIAVLLGNAIASRGLWASGAVIDNQRAGTSPRTKTCVDQRGAGSYCCMPQCDPLLLVRNLWQSHQHRSVFAALTEHMGWKLRHLGIRACWERVR